MSRTRLAAVVFAVLVGIAVVATLGGSDADARRKPLRTYTCGALTGINHDLVIVNTTASDGVFAIAFYGANGQEVAPLPFKQSTEAHSHTAAIDQNFFSVQIKSRTRLLVFGEEGTGKPLNCTG